MVKVVSDSFDYRFSRASCYSKAWFCDTRLVMDWVIEEICS